MIKQENLPEGWELKPLSKVCDVNPRKSEVKDFPSSEKVTFLSMESVGENGEIYSQEIKDLEEVFKGYTYFKKNDVLFAKITPCMENGKGTIALINTDIGFGSTEFHILRSHENVIPEWIYRFLALNYTRKLAEMNMTGSAGQKRVPKTFFDKIKIPVPPLETQKKIVETLEKAENLKEWRAEADELNDEFLKSVFLDMFGDPKNNHHNFKIGKIEDLIIKTQYGTSKKANEDNKGYPILRMNNISYSGKWDFSSLKYIELDESEKEKYLVNNGELLFNRTNSKELVGKAAVYRKDEPMAFAGYLVKLFTDSPATSEYIAGHLNSHYGKAFLFNMAKSIVGMANINAKEVQRVPILIPPMELREKYAEIVKQVEKLRKSQKQSEQQIDNFFNVLMQKAFKGELTC